MTHQHRGLRITLSLKVVTVSLLFFSLFIQDLFITYATGDLDTVNPTSVLFSLVWSLFFSALVLVLPRKIGRIVYLILFMVLVLYGAAQMIYCGIFNKVFPLTTISNLSEGAGYIGATLSYITLGQYCALAILILTAVTVTVLLGKIPPLKKPVRIIALPLSACILAVSQFVLPSTYGEKIISAAWNAFESDRFQYDSYTNPRKVLGLAGYYQFLSVDFYNCFMNNNTANEEAIEEIDNFFETYPAKHTDNDTTGLFRGKNAVIVMLESIDYPAISEQNTPNLDRMMKEGINFSGYYSPVYGNGATFSNEFCLNTGIYAPSNGTAAYAYSGNTFSQSLPNLFKNAGYSANSFHENHGWFYNRAIMHESFGYDAYHSYYDYGGSQDEVIVDTYLTNNDTLLSDVLPYGEESPFLSFVITYSAHLAYSHDSELAAYAFDNYVVDGEHLGESEDLEVLRAKARITDTMLGQLMEQLDNQTVLICVTDHYAYGLDEKTLTAEKGDNWALQQNTPMVIWQKGQNLSSLSTDKICSSADFLPTVANLFGLDIPDCLLGHDIFDTEYEGYVVFSNYSWRNKDVYCQDGNMIPLSDEAITTFAEYEKTAEEKPVSTEETTLAKDTVEAEKAETAITRNQQAPVSSAKSSKNSTEDTTQTEDYGVITPYFQIMKEMMAYTYSRIPINDSILATDYYQTAVSQEN